MKAYTALAVSLIVLGIVFKDNLDKRKEISELKDSITAYNKAQEKSVKTITKVREVIKNVQEPCDCYNQPIPSDVIKLLQ